MELFHEMFSQHRIRLQRPRAERHIGDWLACMNLQDLHSEAARAEPAEAQS